MKVEITGRHVDITPAIRSFVQKRLNKLNKSIKDDLEVHVILSVEKHRHIAEIVLKSKILHLTSLEQTSDMYSSITRAADKLDRQALKYRQKRFIAKRRVGTNHRPRTRGAGASETNPGNLIIEKTISKKPMAIEEAIIDLHSSDDSFVVFRDADSQSINVVYKRKDGNIGLIRA